MARPVGFTGQLANDPRMMRSRYTSTMPLAPRVETISWGPGCVRPRRGYGHPDPLQAIDGARFAFIDIISPCVTFNDHDGSTKSYAYTREHKVEVVQADFVPPADEISADYQEGSVQNVTT